MSLVVYKNMEDIPSNLKVIKLNDVFFNTETELSNNEIVKAILSEIDKATINSELTFVGRTKELGALNKNMLSTGTKTLLNILQHPEYCFDVCECGNNALCFLPLIKEGNILWEDISAAYSGNGVCDILYGGKNYSNFYEFLSDAYQG